METNSVWFKAGQLSIDAKTLKTVGLNMRFGWYSLTSPMRTWMLLILCLTGCVVLHPSEWWQPAQTANFTFSLPPSLQSSSPPHANAAITQFTNQDMTFTFDEGAAAGESLDSLGHYGHYTSSFVQIGGAFVQVVAFDLPPGGGHRFDYGIAASYRGMGLTIYAHCRTREEYDTARKIFRSVRHKPSPNPKG